MKQEISNLLAAIPFDDLWESERLWPDPMEAPDIPPVEDLVAFLEDSKKIDPDLASQIKSSVACLRALDELQTKDLAKDKNSAAMKDFFKKVGITDNQAIEQSDDEVPTNHPVPFPHVRPQSAEVRSRQIRSVRHGYQYWDEESLRRGFNFNPVDLLIISERIERPAGDFFRAVPCSPSEVWRIEDMLCPEDIVFNTVGGSQWVLHTWLAYPVSVDDLDDYLGQLSEEEMTRIHNQIEALNHTEPAEVTEPEWLSLERERIVERADTLPNTVDAQRWKWEAETNIPDNLVTFTSQNSSATALLVARDDAAERPLETRSYRVTDKPASTIQISQSVDPMKLAFEIIEDPADLFAGAGIFDAYGKRLGKIENGIALIDCPQNGCFALFTFDGTPITLEETPDEHQTQS